jgi:hypothetical protein
MAATAQDPPRSVAGREGPLKWAPNPHRPKDEWLAPDGERAPARIRFLSHHWLGDTKETYYVYRNGHFLGMRRSLPDAKKLADSGEADPSPEIVKLTMDGTKDDLPAFMSISQEERRHAWKNAPPLTNREMRTSWRNYRLERQAKGEDLSFMAKYEEMSAEQMAREYNGLVETARGLGLDRFRPVARFKDKDEGLRYIEAVESSIRARQASDQAVKQQARTKTGPVAKEVTPTSPPIPQRKDEDEMATKNGKNGKAKKAKAKKAGPKKAAAAEKAPRAGKVGAFLDQIDARAGSNQEKAGTALFNSLGKPMKVEALCKAVYGKAEVNTAINAVLNGLRGAIEGAKAAYNIQRDRKEGTVGLFAGKQ